MAFACHRQASTARDDRQGTAARLSNRIRNGNSRKHKQNCGKWADDLIVLHSELSIVQQSQKILEKWLLDMGLKLKPSKTRICHTYEKVEGRAGFDFLGFEVRQYRVSKHNRTSIATRKKHKVRDFKTLIKPSKEKVKLHYQKLAKIIDDSRTIPQEALILRLNPVIRGWSRYYSPVVSAITYQKLTNLMYSKLRRWASRRHPQKSQRWIVRKYWLAADNPHWRFATKTGYTLYSHTHTKVIRHTKVQGARSLFDGDWSYWATRMGRHPELPSTTAQLLKKQRGKCPWCGLFFKDGDLLESDHIIPKALKGNEAIQNRQLLHKHCHDQKTAIDGSNPPKRDERTEAERQAVKAEIAEMLKDWSPYPTHKRLTLEEWSKQWY